MTTETTRPNPLELWSESFSAWRDLSQSASAAWMDAMMAMKPGVGEAAPEAETRDLFRKLADLNLQHWEHAAKLIEAMPAWMRWPQTVPGDMMTDWFDSLRRQPGAPYVQSAPRTPTTAARTAEAAEAAYRQPTALTAPEGEADDLTRIKGIGPKLSKTLNELGIFHFKQIANWEAGEAGWIDEFLSFKGRVAREQWIEQAQKFSSNGALH
ncbi:MAG: hypothetical protein MK186_06685 [Henriciella sp.]|nr:hypothetical protein [Henriciella sp.]